MTHPMRRLDRKLRTIVTGEPTSDDFVLADAKDADMGFGLMAAGPTADAAEGTFGPGRYRTRDSYLDAMRAQAASGLIDILLTSASNGELLAAEGAIPEDLTLAVRGNDTTDVWVGRGARYARSPSRPFRSADLASIRPFCDLVLYSVTLNNDVAHDLETLEAYRLFRMEASAMGMRHFLEVFDPNAPRDLAPDAVGAFVNDSIVRLLAGVTSEQRPIFLKVAYHGAEALAELAEHDRSLVVGVLGGSAGTTRDTFELLQRAHSHGAWMALIGRKIQHADSQPALMSLMRPVVRGEIDPAEAVRAYHDALSEMRIVPRRPLAADLELTDPVMRAE